MNCQRRAFLRSGTGAALAFLAFPLVAGQAAADQAKTVGQVADLVGSAFRQRGEAVTQLKIGDPVSADDSLTTGRESKLQVRLLDGSILVLGAESSCALRNLHLPTREAGGRGLITLDGGTLRLLLVKGAGWSGFSVETSTVIASVRGTDFVVESAPAHSAVFVVGGVVAVTGQAGGSARLGPGQGSDILAGEAPSRAKRWPAERVATTLAKVRVTP
ncbi:MAG: hypothetical protein Kilf2KO_07340 [Rhodospirillales bacterium]